MADDTQQSDMEKILNAQYGKLGDVVFQTQNVGKRRISLAYEMDANQASTLRTFVAPVDCKIKRIEITSLSTGNIAGLVRVHLNTVGTQILPFNNNTIEPFTALAATNYYSVRYSTGVITSIVNVPVGRGERIITEVTAIGAARVQCQVILEIELSK